MTFTSHPSTDDRQPPEGGGGAAPSDPLAAGDDGSRHPGASAATYDAVVVGAGFAGMYALERLRGLGLNVVALEAGAGVGGTWYWNKYPGARCDIASIEYSYSFSEKIQQTWSWTETCATQAELLRYANYVADELDLRRSIRFETVLDTAHFDEESSTWALRTRSGEELSTTFLVMASGCLSNPKPPEIEGIETFAGTSFHSSRWPDEGVDLAGRRVGVIGTASTGIQMIPVIAEQVGSLHVFQRTANFCLPARVKPLSDETMASVKSVYPELREKIRRSPAGYLIDTPTRGALEVPAAEREAIYRHAWEENPGAFLGSFNDLRTNIDSNETAAAFVRERIAEIVDDAETAEDLTPRDHPIGAKRICVGTNYYETYNRENVHLVNLRKTPIDRVVPEGVVVDGRLIELDTLIYATGFDAMTGALLAVDIRGRDGISFREKWVAGPRTYLGLAVADFPNLFTITGPGSPSVISNMVFSIEHHVDWIADCIAHMRRNRLTVVEADETAQDDWVEHVNEVANRTLFPRAASWYVGANVPGKPRVFMPYVGGTLSYRATCQEVVDDGYRGFRFAPGSDDDLAALDERMDRADR